MLQIYSNIKNNVKLSALFLLVKILKLLQSPVHLMTHNKAWPQASLQLNLVVHVTISVREYVGPTFRFFQISKKHDFTFF